MRQPPLLRRAGRPSRVDPRLRPAELPDLTIDLQDAVRRSYAAFQDNDVEALLELYHPDLVWDMSHYEGFPEEPVLHGHEGLKKFLNLMHEGIGVTNNEPLEMIELDGHRVFVEGRTTIRGGASGAEVSSPSFGQIIEFRDGQISRVDNYSDPAEARRAAGLSEA